MIELVREDVQHQRSLCAPDETVNLALVVGGDQYNVLFATADEGFIVVTPKNDDEEVVNITVPVEQACFLTVVFKKEPGQPEREIGFGAEMKRKEQSKLKSHKKSPN